MTPATFVILVLTASNPPLITSHIVPSEKICEDLGQQWERNARGLAVNRYKCLVAK